MDGVKGSLPGENCAAWRGCAAPRILTTTSWFSGPSRASEDWSRERLKDLPRAAGQESRTRNGTQELDSRVQILNQSLLPGLPASWLLFFALGPPAALSSQRSPNLTPTVLGTPRVTVTRVQHWTLPNPCCPRFLRGIMNSWMQAEIQRKPELHGPHPHPGKNQLSDACWFPECFNQERRPLVLPDTLQGTAGGYPEAPGESRTLVGMAMSAGCLVPLCDFQRERTSICLNCAIWSY